MYWRERHWLLDHVTTSFHAKFTRAGLQDLRIRDEYVTASSWKSLSLRSQGRLDGCNWWLANNNDYPWFQVELTSERLVGGLVIKVPNAQKRMSFTVTLSMSSSFSVAPLESFHVVSALKCNYELWVTRLLCAWLYACLPLFPPPSSSDRWSSILAFETRWLNNKRACWNLSFSTV